MLPGKLSEPRAWPLGSLTGGTGTCGGRESQPYWPLRGGWRPDRAPTAMWSRTGCVLRSGHRRPVHHRPGLQRIPTHRLARTGARSQLRGLRIETGRSVLRPLSPVGRWNLFPVNPCGVGPLRMFSPGRRGSAGWSVVPDSEWSEV